jgi:proline iminopeptidase
MRSRVNGIELYFDVDGYGLHVRGGKLVEKPVLAVLHGGPGLDHSDLQPWLHPLSREIQLLYVDHRGNGRSQRLPPHQCTPEQMADDLEGLRTTLGIQKLHVLGFSFGSTVALHFAHRHPDSLERVIVCSTPTSSTFLDEARAIVAERGTREQAAAVDELFAGAFRNEEHLAEGLRSLRPLYFRNYSPAFDVSRQWTITNVELINWYFANYGRNFDLRPILPNISAPTLILTGQYDWICPPSQSEPLRQLLPNARQIIFEDSGHIPLKEEHNRFIELVRAFILDKPTEAAHATAGNSQET